MNRGRLIDLSRAHHTRMPVYRVLPRTFLDRYVNFSDYEDGKSPIWPGSSDIWMTSTHAGTHIDAPAHMKPGVQTIDEADLDLMYGDAIRLDFSHLSPGDEISLEMLRRQLAERSLEVSPRLIVLFHTGMSALWEQPVYMENPIGIAPDAVSWMLDEGVMVYGMDASTPDVDNLAMPNHQLLGRRPHHHVENLVNLDRIPSDRFTFLGFPLKLRNATASPIRALALIEDDA